MQAWLCFPSSVMVTRSMIQDEMQIHNTKCDNCLIGTMVCLQYLNCLCCILATVTDIPAVDQAAQAVDCIADAAYVSVCACMQTQARVQMNARDSGKVPGRDLDVMVRSHSKYRIAPTHWFFFRPKYRESHPEN